MIEHLGLRELAIESIKLDGGWRKRIAEPRIAERAESIKELGLIQHPVVRDGDRSIIAGRDRLAACAKLGLERVTVKLIRCSDAEAVQIAAAENLERRHLSPKELREETAKTVAALATAIAKESGKKPKGPGRGGSAQAEAEREVAKKRGVKPESLARSRQRQAKREEEAASAPAAPAPEAEPPIQTFGLSLDADWLGQIEQHQDRIDQALQALTRVTALLGQTGDLPHHPARLQALKEQTAALRETIRGSMPASLCPWCKGQEQALNGCAACQGTALALAHQMTACPPELLSTEPIAYYDHGQLVTIETEEWSIE